MLIFKWFFLGQKGNTLTAKCQARQLYYLQRVSSDTALQANLTFSLLSGEMQRSIAVWTESARRRKTLQSAVHVCEAADLTNYSLGDLYFSSFKGSSPPGADGINLSYTTRNILKLLPEALKIK